MTIKEVVTRNYYYTSNVKAHEEAQALKELVANILDGVRTKKPQQEESPSSPRLSRLIDHMLEFSKKL